MRARLQAAQRAAAKDVPDAPVWYQADENQSEVERRRQPARTRRLRHAPHLIVSFCPLARRICVVGIEPA